jgi:hypothetical protein
MEKAEVVGLLADAGLRTDEFPSEGIYNDHSIESRGRCATRKNLEEIWAR